MKILIVGVFNENSTNNGIANGFENAGHEVVRYDYRGESRKLSGDGNRDTMLYSIIQTDVYDLVFYCKCSGVSEDVLSAGNYYAKTFLWYMDPLNGNYNDELIEKIKAADYVGVAKWEVYLKAKELNPNTHFLIEGFDPKWDCPILCNGNDDKKYDVSFIGNPYGNRKEWLDKLGNVTVLSDKYNIEHSKAVVQSKINLNFTGGGGPSDRVYKILAAGGFLLSEAWPDENRYGLKAGVDYDVVYNSQEMKRYCEYYLKHEDKRNAIAKHGHETVQKFSRDNLAKQIVEIVS